MIKMAPDKQFKVFTIPLILLLLVLVYSFKGTYKKERKVKESSYKLIDDWPKLPANYKLGQVTGIDVDKDQHVLLFHRADRVWTTPFPAEFISSPTILELDGESGEILKSWGENSFIMPHGLTVDSENNIWVTDVALHQVFKFTHDGKLLLKVGEAGIAGNDSLHFDMPTDVAVCSDGSFYVSDGYGNSRVVKFSKNGNYLFEWGKKGEAPSEFNTPHAIDLDKKGNVYVADRENNRIQKFEPNGNFISEWKNTEAKQLYSLTIDKEKSKLFAIDYLFTSQEIKGSDILLFESHFKSNKRVGRSGGYTGHVCRYHDIAVDKKGNLYVGDILGNTIQKFSGKH